MDSNVQVSIEWKNSTVFASEPIECTITFTNASNARARRSPSPTFRSNGRQRERWRNNLSEHNSSSHVLSTDLSPSRGFQASTNIKQITGSQPHNNSERSASGAGDNGKAVNAHRRSISIVSISGDNAEFSPDQASHVRTRPAHGRAASMQFATRRSGAPSPTPVSRLNSDRAITQPALASHLVKPHLGEEKHLQQRPRLNLKRHSTSTGTAQVDHEQSADWGFPRSSTLKDTIAVTKHSFSGNPADSLRVAASPPSWLSTTNADLPNLATKILSPGSVGGTPRSSGEFFSLSNNSTETLASDYPSREAGQLLPKAVHRRQGSSLGPLRVSRTETLMMGYAQVMGSFTLDGSLVNQSLFEDVKRKAIVGGQGGGGLVRSFSTRKRDSGLLSSFGWGNLGDTFGGLLGDTGMSSIKEAKKSSGQKAVPILSAPQSILFVDLQLHAGESKSFHFSHPTPPGIPPSHKGKAIKVEYSLVVGTQRSTKIGQQDQIRRVEVPFRVLPTVNEQGDILGHELTSPHTLLSDSATVIALERAQLNKAKTTAILPVSDGPTALNGFSEYVENLLEQSQMPQNAILLSPTDDHPKSLVQPSNSGASVKELVDLALINSSSGLQSKGHVNRFEIKRGGERVAIIILSRPAYRLGESISIIIDFQEVDVACYSVHATLESSEIIDPTIALRSKASIQRVTRRTHASYHESTIASDRIFLQPVIPTASTPEFVTSGVSLEWNLRFEFTTGRPNTAGDDDENPTLLMEEIARDDRGIVQAAIQGLACDVFDVIVPIRVYGAPAAFDGHASSGMLSI